MDEIKILEAVERYLAGEMHPDERSAFENLRKSNPEIDLLVVEHRFFLQQINRYEDVRGFKSKLTDAHLHLAEEGAITSPEPKGKAKVIQLFNRYKRTAGIAASIAGITALSISALIWSVSPAKPINKKDLETLNRTIRVIDNKVNQVKNENAALQQQISNL
ncbi:MAG: serine protease, partial [Chitinophagaceae bacterium]